MRLREINTETQRHSALFVCFVYFVVPFPRSGRLRVSAPLGLCVFENFKDEP